MAQSISVLSLPEKPVFLMDLWHANCELLNLEYETVSCELRVRI